MRLACYSPPSPPSSSRDPVQVLDDAKDSVPSLDVSDHEILTGSVDGYVRCYDLRVGQLRTDCIGEPVTSVQLSHDGNCMLASSLDGTIRLLDKTSGELLSEFRGHRNKVGGGEVGRGGGGSRAQLLLPS